MKRLRLLLVDDHALFREGLAALLSYQDDIEVIGEAEDAEGALKLVGALNPDVVLMDIDLPGEDGVVATRRVKAAWPDVSVVMLTVHDETDKLIDAIKAGADGYLLKNVRSTELVEQLRGVTRGEAAISRRIATQLLEEFRREDDPREPEAELTTRELEILTLVADCLSNSEIARRLFISEHTVKNHIKNILSKLNLRSRRQAATYGIARGWVRPTPGDE